MTSMLTSSFPLQFFWWTNQQPSCYWIHLQQVPEWILTESCSVDHIGRRSPTIVVGFGHAPERAVGGWAIFPIRVTTKALELILYKHRGSWNILQLEKEAGCHIINKKFFKWMTTPASFDNYLTSERSRSNLYNYTVTGQNSQIWYFLKTFTSWTICNFRLWTYDYYVHLRKFCQK